MQDFLYFFVELQQNMYDISYMNDLIKIQYKKFNLVLQGVSMCGNL